MNAFIWLIVITPVNQTMLLLDANVLPEPLEIKGSKFNKYVHRSCNYAL
ncbi:hypothetical protein LACPH_002284 [Lacticaseibacillus parahuelsenbergensis]|uniref:Uncharacterized protein n=1 Tax=Lacticaseibacillus parahuelsenbergensis TaxID=3068305 RepID=A0ABY9L1J5_9LACO|nr:hypothetical protein [Lacticaseibacillus sp. NCIMB 15471]WLV77530.1 hypothetical protein LACPH_002284 [Lacticaseibacillus sp. NCIMB 15471]